MKTANLCITFLLLCCMLIKAAGTIQPVAAGLPAMEKEESGKTEKPDAPEKSDAKKKIEVTEYLVIESDHPNISAADSAAYGRLHNGTVCEAWLRAPERPPDFAA
ncbi:hypothetical protein [Pedobacter sp. SYP-B3415]|uniref:hypothetical protein n=1 Tax=Pedobacter sp. SYP-B3415 TaxID=2496641 RepID=UPI00101C482F|nr:hypothetical protein [Pedobacter sp. SYP-B3415]